MALARSRQVDVVIVTKFDRFARSLKHLITMLEELRDLDVAFVSTGDQIDFSTASGRLMFHLLAAFGEFELSLIRERTLAGLAYARLKGKKLGRPRSRDYEAIVKLREKGLSYSQIQKHLGCERSTIYRALRAMAKTQSREAFQLAEKTRHRRAV
jgi:DNA invertase Pin-like site-specific DNA recombinase